MTPDNVNAYIAELKGRVRSRYGSICTKRRAARGIAPGGDFTWLSEIDNDPALVVLPRSKFDRMVIDRALVEAGLTLIHEAENSPSLTDRARASQVRNGLMVALLALCPIRLKNFVALEIGRSFVKIRGRLVDRALGRRDQGEPPGRHPIDLLLIPFH